jgi:hypothetical protein
LKEAHLYWASQPTHVRLFLLYLFGVAAVGVVNAVKLARLLYSIPGQRAGISFEEMIFKDVGAKDALAESALGGRGLAYMSLEAWHNETQSAILKIDGSQVLRRVEAAGNRFDYLWGGCHADVTALRRASTPVLLLSLLVVVYGAFPTFHDFCNNSKLVPLDCLILTLDQLLTRLALGLGCCLALHLAANWFDRALIRRKTRWKYFSESLKTELRNAHSRSGKGESS